MPCLKIIKHIQFWCNLCALHTFVVLFWAKRACVQNALFNKLTLVTIPISEQIYCPPPFGLPALQNPGPSCPAFFFNMPNNLAEILACQRSSPTYSHYNKALSRALYSLIRPFHGP